MHGKYPKYFQALLTFSAVIGRKFVHDLQVLGVKLDPVFCFFLWCGIAAGSRSYLRF